jgi:uncharacterized membrane protein YedE/YeeE
MYAEFLQFTLFILGFCGMGAYILVKEGSQNYYIAYILFAIAGAMLLYAVFCLAYCYKRNRMTQKPEDVVVANPIDLGDDPSNEV